MTLGELIAELEKHDPRKRLRHGFYDPHSYRGYYDELAFQPKENTTVGEMLAAARSVEGQTFDGWRGGEYTYGKDTPVWLAESGCSGESLGPRLLAYMLADVAEEEPI